MSAAEKSAARSASHGARRYAQSPTRASDPEARNRQRSLFASTATGWAKLACDWSRNRKLRQVGAPAVLVYFALVALRARLGIGAAFTLEQLAELDAELEPWRRELGRLDDVLDELAGVGLLSQDTRHRWVLVGWNPSEWGTGFPRGDAQANLEPCARCHGARMAEPGRKSCRHCRERDRERWRRRAGNANARRRKEQADACANQSPNHHGENHGNT